MISEAELIVASAPPPGTPASGDVDGPPEIHDVHRPLKNGRGSFWHIVNTVPEAVANLDYSRTRFQFRTNVDVANTTSIPRYIGLMAELGFAQPNVFFSIQPVHSGGNDVSQLEMVKSRFAEQELGWLRLLRANQMNTEVLPLQPSMVVCPAVTLAGELVPLETLQTSHRPQITLRPTP
jgi:uncharacterized protein